MDAIGVAVFSVGGFLLYASIKGEHPWSLFLQTLGASAPTPGSSPTNAVPYTGPQGQPATIQGQTVTLPQGVSAAGGGTGAIHG